MAVASNEICFKSCSLFQFAVVASIAALVDIILCAELSLLWLLLPLPLLFVYFRFGHTNNVIILPATNAPSSLAFVWLVSSTSGCDSLAPTPLPHCRCHHRRPLFSQTSFPFLCEQGTEKLIKHKHVIQP